MILLALHWPFVRLQARSSIVFTKADALEIQKQSLQRTEREMKLGENLRAAEKAAMELQQSMQLAAKIASAELDAARESAATGNYRFRRLASEPWSEFEQRFAQVLRSAKDTPALLAMLDLVDAAEREALAIMAEARGEELVRAQGALDGIRSVRQRIVAKVYAGDQSSLRARERRSREDVLRLMDLDEERLAAMEADKNQRQALERANRTS